MGSFPRVERWLATAALDQNHEARNLSLSDPIVPALEYFLSLDRVSGFEERLSLLEKEPIGPPTRNIRAIKWASHCAELGAISLIGQELGLEILGFDLRSPRAPHSEKNCDVTARVEDTSTFFEVKRQCAEDLQIPPPLLRARLLELDVPYCLSLEMRGRDYDCKDLDEILRSLREHLDFMHDPENRELWWPNDSAPPQFASGPFVVWFHEQDDSAGLWEHFEPVSGANIKRWLRSKCQEAYSKGADYLITRVEPLGPWRDLVTECFGRVVQEAPRTYSLSGATLGGLRGLILFSRHDRFCIVNDPRSRDGPTVSA